MSLLKCGAHNASPHALHQESFLQQGSRTPSCVWGRGWAEWYTPHLGFFPWEVQLLSQYYTVREKERIEEQTRRRGKPWSLATGRVVVFYSHLCMTTQGTSRELGRKTADLNAPQPNNASLYIFDPESAQILHSVCFHYLRLLSHLFLALLKEVVNYIVFLFLPKGYLCITVTIFHFAEESQSVTLCFPTNKESRKVI